jgi:hypothetical protein
MPDDPVAAAEITVECQRCRRRLVDLDEVGWFYQKPVTSPEAPGLTFMDRVHECDGKPHSVRPQDDLGCVAARWESMAVFLEGRAKLVPLTDGMLLARAALYQECSGELRVAISRALLGEEEPDGDRS